MVHQHVCGGCTQENAWCVGNGGFCASRRERTIILSRMVENMWGRCHVLIHKDPPPINDDPSPGAANTFNDIERVYSRAIAFSNRRCSVPLLPTSQVCTVSSSIRTAFI